MVVLKLSIVKSMYNASVHVNSPDRYKSGWKYAMSIAFSTVKVAISVLTNTDTEQSKSEHPQLICTDTKM